VGGALDQRLLCRIWACEMYNARNASENIKVDKGVRDREQIRRSDARNGRK